jgi:hypothetical protein
VESLAISAATAEETRGPKPDFLPLTLAKIDMLCKVFQLLWSILPKKTSGAMKTI